MTEKRLDDHRSSLWCMLEGSVESIDARNRGKTSEITNVTQVKASGITNVTQVRSLGTGSRGRSRLGLLQLGESCFPDLWEQLLAPAAEGDRGNYARCLRVGVIR